MLTQTTFQGESAWVLENDFLRAVILPKHGGKLTSLVYRQTQFELLFQNPKGRWGNATFGSDFSEFEACGFDDAFPNVDAGTVETRDRMLSYPDHGAIWSTEMQACAEGEVLHLFCKSNVFDFSYQKQIWLNRNQIILEYAIKNTGREVLPAIWTCHCLVNTETDMEIWMPASVKTVENVITGKWLGEGGTELQYPIAEINGHQIDLRRLPPDEAIKYYAKGPVGEGRCGYRYPGSGMEATFRYDAEQLPYLGLWVTSGGYRGDYNCALEPTDGYYDKVDKAMESGCCPLYLPQQEKKFSLTIELCRMK